MIVEAQILLPMIKCVECDFEMDRADEVITGDRKLPLPGSFSICLNCGHLSVYREDMRLREPTDHEIINLGESGMLGLIDRAQRYIRSQPKDWAKEKSDAKRKAVREVQGE